MINQNLLFLLSTCHENWNVIYIPLFPMLSPMKIEIDLGEYARQLMYNALAEMKNHNEVRMNPWIALTWAYITTKIEGSSTACLLKLWGLPGNIDILHVVNGGDSGFLVIRSGKILCWSQSQQHFLSVLKIISRWK